jgi:hypothetical protein
MNLYQPETWVCGNKRTNEWIIFGGVYSLAMIDPVGKVVRVPRTEMEKVCVEVVDDFFERIGVKTR